MILYIQFLGALPQRSQSPEQNLRYLSGDGGFEAASSLPILRILSGTKAPCDTIYIYTAIQSFCQELYFLTLFCSSATLAHNASIRLSIPPARCINEAYSERKVTSKLMPSTCTSKIRYIPSA